MTVTATRIIRNDDSEEFVLKTPTVRSTVSRSVVTRAVLSAAGGLVGGDPIIGKEVFAIQNVAIRDISPDDYPNSGTYSDHNLGFKQELLRAAKTWSPSVSNGLDVFHYDGEEHGGVLTDVQITENVQEDAPRQYSATLEWTAYDAYIG